MTETNRNVSAPFETKEFILHFIYSILVNTIKMAKI